MYLKFFLRSIYYDLQASLKPFQEVFRSHNIDRFYLHSKHRGKIRLYYMWITLDSLMQYLYFKRL